MKSYILLGAFFFCSISYSFAWECEKKYYNPAGGEIAVCKGVGKAEYNQVKEMYNGEFALITSKGSEYHMINSFVVRMFAKTQLEVDVDYADAITYYDKNEIPYYTVENTIVDGMKLHKQMFYNKKGTPIKNIVEANGERVEGCTEESGHPSKRGSNIDCGQIYRP